MFDISWTEFLLIGVVALIVIGPKELPAVLRTLGQWTRKVRGKTVSVALSREQYEWLKEAIAHWRDVQQTLKAMQRLSRQVLFATVPHPRRRKRLGKKVLGLI